MPWYHGPTPCCDRHTDIPGDGIVQALVPPTPCDRHTDIPDDWIVQALVPPTPCCNRHTDIPDDGIIQAWYHPPLVTDIPGDGIVHALVHSGYHPPLVPTDVADICYLPCSVVAQSQLLKLPLCNDKNHHMLATLTLGGRGEEGGGSSLH